MSLEPVPTRTIAGTWTVEPRVGERTLRGARPWCGTGRTSPLVRIHRIPPLLIFRGTRNSQRKDTVLYKLKELHKAGALPQNVVCTVQAKDKGCDARVRTGSAG